MLFHCILTAYEITKLSSEIMSFFGIDLKEIYNVALPKPAVWEWIWITGSIFVLPSLFAIRKNNVAAMKTFIAGIIICGIFPLLWAVSYLLMSGDLKTFFVLGTASDKIEKFNGVPLVALTTSFVTLGFVTHILSVMYAKNLIAAWATRKTKRA